MHQKRRIVHAVLVSSVCGLFALVGCAQPAPDNTGVNARDRAEGTVTAPDNTGVNVRDRAEGAVTADQQKENDIDRDLAQKIRQALMDDASLSTYGHNVKVISQGGEVTLKGPVRSEEEKQSIEAKAKAIAGSARVINEMTVAPATE